MNEYYKESKYNFLTSEKFCKAACAFSFLTFLGCLGFQVYISNTTALKGKDFQQYYEKKLELQKEIALLEFQDSNLSSLEFIEEKAVSLGFVTITEALLPIVPPTLASLDTP